MKDPTHRSLRVVARWRLCRYAAAFRRRARTLEFLEQPALPALEEVHVGPITELITAFCASLVFVLGLGVRLSALRPRDRWKNPRKDLLRDFGFRAGASTGFTTSFLCGRLLQLRA